jgi:RNA polymerase sigma-70 factor (ECF subfamily)
MGTHDHVPLEPRELQHDLLEFRDRFLGYVRKRVDDPELAEDILQDSLLRALQASPTLRQ